MKGCENPQLRVAPASGVHQAAEAWKDRNDLRIAFPSVRKGAAQQHGPGPMPGRTMAFASDGSGGAPLSTRKPRQGCVPDATRERAASLQW